MSTDVTNQQLHVVAKDLLIASITCERQIQLSGDAEAAAKELVSAYKIILKGLREAVRP